MLAEGTAYASRLRSSFGSNEPVSLLYHGVPGSTDCGLNSGVFERQIMFLVKHFDVVPLSRSGDWVRASGKPQITITFDDGFRNNAEVVAPILRRHQVPATFFVCRRHAERGRYLWFSYLRALESHFTADGFYLNGEFVDMSAVRRRDSITRLRKSLLALRPHPGAMYEVVESDLPMLSDFVAEEKLRDLYDGLSEEQIGELADDDLFSVQAHTDDHPFLTACDPAEAARQLTENKAWIERVTGVESEGLAYPAGDYNAPVIDLCRKAGFAYGHAVISRNLGLPPFEIPRVGVYSPSVSVLSLKAGFGHAIRSLRIRVG